MNSRFECQWKVPRSGWRGTNMCCPPYITGPDPGTSAGLMHVACMTHMHLTTRGGRRNWRAHFRPAHIIAADGHSQGDSGYVIFFRHVSELRGCERLLALHVDAGRTTSDTTCFRWPYGNMSEKQASRRLASWYHPWREKVLPGPDLWAAV